MINGKDFAGKESDGYIMLPENLKTGDRILFACTPVLRFLDEKRNVIPMETLTAKPVQAAIQYGPWLLSVDEVYQNLFMTEVSERNVLYLPAVNTFGVADPSLVPEKSFNPEAYLACEFLKDGTSQTGTVILRPMSEASFQGPSNVRFWLLVARKP
jgi:hypothetical protein